MMLDNANFQQRIKAGQLAELLELGRLKLATQVDAETFTVEVPASRGLPARLGQIKIDKLSDTPKGWRIEVRYPFKQSGEMTATWESPK